MASSFLPRLVNGPFDDPALFVPFRYENRALLFDLGDITALSSRDILKISHVFITHTHMDHFIGFDHLLRILLGRDKDLCLYGPPGFIQNLEGKLAGYCWNLVGTYQNRFILNAVEVHPDHTRSSRYACHKSFRRDKPIIENTFDGIVLQEPGLAVRAVFLDHGTPVLGFALRERFRINIDKSALKQWGLTPGPWLNRLKSLIYGDADPDTLIELPHQQNDETPVQRSVKKLQEAIVVRSTGQSLAYITDASGTAENVKKMISLARGVDHLYVEAAFSEKDRDMALEKNHLTARMAGDIARSCGVKHFSVFHFSPRYTECPEKLVEEAIAAFHDCSKPSLQSYF